MVEIINPTAFMQCFTFTFRIQRQNSVLLNKYDYYEGLAISGCSNTNQKALQMKHFEWNLDFLITAVPTDTNLVTSIMQKSL